MKNIVKTACGVALLGAAFGALAQSNVTVYGWMDLGLQEVRTPSANIAGVVSGGRSGSRLGFRATEDLGAGLSVNAVLEQGINLDTGTLGQSNRAFGRQSFISLNGGFGVLAIGRLAMFSGATGTFDMYQEVDPFIDSFGIAGVSSTMSSAQIQRADNTVLYQSPQIAGFQAGYFHSFQFNGNEVGPTSSNLRVNGFALKYGKSPLTAVVTYDRFQNPGIGAIETHLQSGVAYDFKVVRLMVEYGRETNLYNSALNVSGTSNGAGARTWVVGGTAPVFGGLFRTSYQRRDGERRGLEKRDISVASVGYEYELSKRTMLYGVFADSIGKGTLDRNATYDRKVLTAGILHRF